MKQLSTGPWSIPAEFELMSECLVTLYLAMDLGEGKPMFLFHDVENAIGLPENSSKGSLGYGLAGVIFGHYGRIKSTTIGGYKVDDVLTGFTSKEYDGRDVRFSFHERY